MEVDTDTMQLKQPREKKHISLDRWLGILAIAIGIIGPGVTYFVKDALAEKQIQINAENVAANREGIASNSKRTSVLEDRATRLEERQLSIAREQEKIEEQLKYLERKAGK